MDFLTNIFTVTKLRWRQTKIEKFESIPDRANSFPSVERGSLDFLASQNAGCAKPEEISIQRRMANPAPLIAIHFL
ncbi:MAG: hypothetical protein D6728_01455 [Cyanobacteria bacterium J055]|nr:MAG: hypothetical protein D6728_01455 [Cyanobacteria bacterium J055]